MEVGRCCRLVCTAEEVGQTEQERCYRPVCIAVAGEA